MAKKPQIKFAHAYNKLLNDQREVIKEAKLLLALPVPMETISTAKDFLDYDTDNGRYTLGFSTFYVMLLFQKPFGDLFTTVRPMHGRYGNKHEYYKQFIGKEFDIVVAKEVQHG